MNRSLRLVAVIAAIMFFALLGQLSFNYVARSDFLTNHPNNRRVRDAEYGETRGPILVSNSPIAQTVAAKGRFAHTRTYADGPLYAPLTGFYSYTYGRSGLEQRYNSQLTGTDDSQFVGNLVDLISGRRPDGASLQTTINARAQQAAWAGLSGLKGAVVAMDYTTGAVLAYVSSPSFDPNQLAGSDIETTQTAWKHYLDDPTRPLSDRASAELYPPGSTFKLVVAAAAFADGMTPDTLIDSPVKMQLPGSTNLLPNWGSCGGGRITIRQALTVSCNTAFANLGLILGPDKIRAQAEKFGFGTAFSGDFSSAISRFSKDPDPAQTALSSIGQFEVASTPLQITSLTAAIANNGVQMEPYVVSEIRNPDLSLLSKHQPKRLRTSVSAPVSEQLRSMMVDVVAKGTGHKAQIPGLTIGAKTGTAESDLIRAPYAWFTGWSAQSHVAVTVFVEDSIDSKDSILTGRDASPIAKSIFEALR